MHILKIFVVNMVYKLEYAFGTANIYFSDVQQEYDYAVMIKTLDLHTDQMLGYLKNLFSSMGMEDQELQIQLQQAKFEISDYNIFEYYYHPGIPITVITTRSALFEMAGDYMEQLEQIIVQLKE